ncbi:MAG: glutathione synthase [Parasphingorhabdus sp.]|jgi:glutathione synthase
MKHVFIMDSLDQVKPWKDTTYHLMLAAATRSHEVFKLAQMDMFLEHNRLAAWVYPVAVHDNHAAPFTIGEKQRVYLDEMDVVWERTDPPFNRRYFYTSLLLDFLPESVRVINRPSAIRDWNEKLGALKFPEFTPQTLVSSSRSEIQAFANKQGRITLKPIDGHGGKGIRFCNSDDDNIASVIDESTHNGSHWIIAQQYLPAADQGDKRILLLEGETIGAILRLHADGVELNNLDAGGSANATEITPREQEICEAMSNDLLRSGILFAGIDIIGGMLIEVNVTSPTGLQEASQFSGRDLNLEIIDHLSA